MTKEFIPYEQALALKELGFDEPCMMNHYGDERLHIGRLYLPSSFGKGKNSEMFEDALRDGDITAILYQQAFRWFREKCGLWQIVMQNTDKDWTYDIMTIIGMVDYKIFDVFDTYEEAELECLKKLIEIVMNKK